MHIQHLVFCSDSFILLCNKNLLQISDEVENIHEMLCVSNSVFQYLCMVVFPRCQDNVMAMALVLCTMSLLSEKNAKNYFWGVLIKSFFTCLRICFSPFCKVSRHLLAAYNNKCESRDLRLNVHSGLQNVSIKLYK